MKKWYIVVIAIIISIIAIICNNNKKIIENKKVNENNVIETLDGYKGKLNDDTFNYEIYDNYGNLIYYTIDENMYNYYLEHTDHIPRGNIDVIPEYEQMESN